MRDYQSHVLFTAFMLVVTALAIVTILTFGNEILKKDRAAFCKDDTLPPVTLSAPSAVRGAIPSRGISVVLDAPAGQSSIKRGP